MSLVLSRAEPARSWVELMAPAVELAKAIANTDFVPRGLRNNPAAISACILYGDEVGLGPLQSLAKIAVIDGRPFVAAEAQRALVYAAGHELWLDEATNARATWVGRRAGSDQVTRITWTMDDARRAHLDGKPNWRSYPRAMLSARASADLVRAVFADVVGGLAAIEEYDDADAPVAALPSGAPDAGTRRRSRTPRRERPAPAAVPAAPTAPPLPPLPHELPDVGDPEPITAGQRNRMMALFRRHEIGDRRERLHLSSEWIGRPIASAAELTSSEADRIIGQLEQLGEPDDGALPPTDEPDDVVVEAEQEPLL